jgi:hypothetical protein
MPTKKRTSLKGATKKSGKNGQSGEATRARKSSASPSKKSPTRNAKAGGTGANGKSGNGGSAPSKRRLTKKDFDKMTANEVMLLAWELTYANRHKRLT